MGTNTNTTTKGLIMGVALSSCVVSLPYEEAEFLLPSNSLPITYQIENSGWDDNVFSAVPDYKVYSQDTEELKVILEFSQKVLKNSSNINSEYVDIVNENFWELI